MNSRQTVEYVQKANLVVLDGKVVKSREYPTEDVAWYGDYHIVNWDKETKCLVLKSLSNRREGRSVPQETLQLIYPTYSTEASLERFIIKHMNSQLDRLEAGMDIDLYKAVSGRISGMRFCLTKLQQLGLFNKR